MRAEAGRPGCGIILITVISIIIIIISIIIIIMISTIVIIYISIIIGIMIWGQKLAAQGAAASSSSSSTPSWSSSSSSASWYEGRSWPPRARQRKLQVSSSPFDPRLNFTICQSKNLYNICNFCQSKKKTFLLIICQSTSKPNNLSIKKSSLDFPNLLHLFCFFCLHSATIAHCILHSLIHS